MIAYSHGIYTEAGIDRRLDISKKTNQMLSYTYYCELTKKFRNRELTDDEYYDWEMCRFKYDINQRT